MFALALPLISFVHDRWGFDALFRLLAMSAAIILAATLLLPRSLPTSTPAAATAR